MNEQAGRNETISNATITRCQRCGELTNFADQPHYKAMAEAVQRIANAVGFGESYTWEQIVYVIEGLFAARGDRELSQAHIEAAAAAIANARGGRRGVPPIANVMDMLPEKLKREVREDAEAALKAVIEPKRT